MIMKPISIWIVLVFTSTYATARDKAFEEKLFHDAEAHIAHARAASKALQPQCDNYEQKLKQNLADLHQSYNHPSKKIAMEAVEHLKNRPDFSAIQAEFDAALGDLRRVENGNEADLQIPSGNPHCNEISEFELMKAVLDTIPHQNWGSHEREVLRKALLQRTHTLVLEDPSIVGLGIAAAVLTQMNEARLILLSDALFVQNSNLKQQLEELHTQAANELNHLELDESKADWYPSLSSSERRAYNQHVLTWNERLKPLANNFDQLWKRVEAQN